MRFQRFEIIEELGSGGMGKVYRARDPHLERDVAIKVLLDASPAVTGPLSGIATEETLDLRGDKPMSASDLLHEARVMARLSHPNVLPIYEVGIVDGAVFLVMEHVEGTNLASWLAEPRPLTAIFDVFAQAARGLAAAHAHGIVHRDFKPGNVLVGSDGRVRVGDFGLSRLVAVTAMVRVDDGRGTPHYMAPELWTGAPATMRSDMFAFCTALRDAIEGHDIPPQLREVIEAGLAEDPAKRGDLATAIAALEHRSSRRRAWLFAATAAAAVALGGVAFAAFRGGDEPQAIACSMRGPTPDVAQRIHVQAALLSHQQPGLAVTADQLLAMLDAKHRVISEELQATCKAERARDITRAQARSRASCLERRTFELVALIDRLSAAPRDLSNVRERLQVYDGGSCATINAPPLTDRRAAETLYARWVTSYELAVPTRAIEHARELEAIESAAKQRGELELAARAAQSLGIELVFEDKLADADAAYQRAHRIATDIHATNLAASILVKRADVAKRRGDMQAATAMAELAHDLVGEPTITPVTRAMLYTSLGKAEIQRGDYKEAVELLRKALAELAASHDAYPALDASIRAALHGALGNLGDRPGLLDNARQGMAVAKAYYGERSYQYANALNIYGSAQFLDHDFAGALATHRQGIAILAAQLPPASAPVVTARARIASDLNQLGEFEQARKILLELRPVVEANAALGDVRANIMGTLAQVTFDAGHHDEGRAIARDAYEDALGTFGKNHKYTRDALGALITMEMKLGNLKEAERYVTMLGKPAYGSDPNTQARIDLVRATFAQAKKKPTIAEALARKALRIPGEHQQTAYIILASSLREQRRNADAHKAIAKAQQLAKAEPVRGDRAAHLELAVAQLEIAEGKRAAGLARARRARAGLEKFPGEVSLRDSLDKLVGKKR